LVAATGYVLIEFILFDPWDVASMTKIASMTPPIPRVIGKRVGVQPTDEAETKSDTRNETTDRTFGYFYYRTAFINRRRFSEAR
jgi:hypothetical protein